MFSFGESNWISLFFCGTAAIVLSWMTSGCRIGNYVEDPKPPPQNPDQISGYYISQAQTLNFFITTTTAATTLQATAPVSMIPTTVSNTMSNPIALIMQDLSSGLADIVTPSGQDPLPIFVNSDLSLVATWNTAPQTFWQDPSCQTYLEFAESGTLTKNSSLAPPTGFSQTVSGSIQLHFQVITHFQGNCVPTFQGMSNCYQDSTQCGGADSAHNLQIQSDVVAIFDPWIQLKLISATDIPNIVNYAFEATYQ